MTGPFHLGQWELDVTLPFYGLAELYHTVMLQCILAYEKRSGKTFNKGMVYGNLGVAQIANGKLDEGIASLLAADHEDREFIGRDPHHILNERLWRQFETPRIVDHLVRITKPTCEAMHVNGDQAFIEKLLRSVELQDRLLLEGSIWAILDNLALDRSFSGVHTRSRLLSAIRDLCWLIESLLLRSPAGASHKARNPEAGMQSLLCNAIGGSGVPFPNGALSCKASTAKEFEANLRSILSSEVMTEARVLHSLTLVRNYTAHNFDPAPSPDWFPLYEQALGQVLSALFYLSSIGALYRRTIVP
jgi:hypothetical protein